jgi:protein SCO1/2
MKFILSLLILSVALSFPLSQIQAHQESHKEQPGVGLEEKLGQVVPPDLIFKDEKGNPVRLGELIHRPTILAPVYYHCPDVCSLLLHNLARALNQLSSEPGKEYGVVAFSFDEQETPGLALEKKGFYLKMIEKPFPEEAWRFLTDGRENIHQLTEAVGFRFKREGKDFLHPVSLIILSREGKIVRYLYGPDPLPLDLKMGLLEASEGRVGPAITKVLRFCFSYDPKGRKYVFNTLKVTATVTILFALSFGAFLLFKGKRHQPKEGE